MVYEHVRAAIDDSGIKRCFLADKIGLTEPKLSATLNGKRKMSVDEFLAISKVLGKSANELIAYPLPISQPV